jgi:hypothetical protein
VRLPVHLPGLFATLDAPYGGGKRKMPSSFPGSLSRADFRAGFKHEAMGFMGFFLCVKSNESIFIYLFILGGPMQVFSLEKNKNQVGHLKIHNNLACPLWRKNHMQLKNN